MYKIEKYYKERVYLIFFLQRYTPFFLKYVNNASNLKKLARNSDIQNFDIHVVVDLDFNKIHVIEYK